MRVYALLVTTMSMSAVAAREAPVVVPTSPLPATAACTNTADGAIWNATGRANFHTYMQACGVRCFGAAACVSDCVRDDEHYSGACAGCFGNVAACTVRHCVRACGGGGGDSPACEACVQSACGADFRDCAGFALPS